MKCNHTSYRFISIFSSKIIYLTRDHVFLFISIANQLAMHWLYGMMDLHTEC